jgi:hypothetical protein
VPYSAQVGIVYLELGINHSYASDLTIILSHAGVTATIMAYNAPNSPANLGGFYTFEDTASASWSQAVTGLPTTTTVPPGYYRPLSPFSAFHGLDQAGPWYLTLCDQASADTGILYGAKLTIAPAAWDLQISQPNGPASVTVANSGGVMGNTYANLMTLSPGTFPNGWLHGVDMSFQEIATEVALGGPFYGVLGPCGSASTTVAGPIPSGLTVYVTSLELDTTGSIAGFKPAFSYTTP